MIDPLMSHRYMTCVLKYRHNKHSFTLFKSGNKTDPGNYRLIYIHPNLRILFEKVVTDQLYSFFSISLNFFPPRNLDSEKSYQFLMLYQICCSLLTLTSTTDSQFHLYLLISVEHSFVLTTKFSCIN